MPNNIQMPVALMQKRFSCRAYTGEPLKAADRQAMTDFMETRPSLPFQSPVRIAWVAAEVMKGAYGNIQKPAAFLAGIVGASDRNLEDAGYWLEQCVLAATGLGLGTCWVGGSFQPAQFAKAMQLPASEMVPAVISLGYPSGKTTLMDVVVKTVAGSRTRKPWEEIYFAGNFRTPLARTAAGEWQHTLEALRVAPSAANRQPWRIVHDPAGRVFHFFLKRSPEYQKILKARGMVDLQRMDLGIAMCHFELAAQVGRLTGHWERVGFAGEMPEHCEYLVSWVGLPA